uniref:3',5'-cyclic-GMP phosphodiesterase n=1 Tax=Labrus bergylta TaxID=56723 RepID=A0A3Q3GJB1_9LABR
MTCGKVTTSNLNPGRPTPQKLLIFAGGAACTKAAPPKFKQKEVRQFKSKAPKAGQKGFDDVPGMEGLGGAEVICPWEAFGDMELSDLAQFGIV